MPPFAELLPLALPTGFLVACFGLGSALGHLHRRSLRIREAGLRRMPLLTARRVPPTFQVKDARLVTGSAVVSLDHGRRALAGLRQLVGGRLRSHQQLMERARREALVRMAEQARTKGCGAVVAVRLETARIASRRRGGKGTAGLEVLAFGTGLILGR